MSDVRFESAKVKAVIAELKNKTLESMGEKTVFVYTLKNHIYRYMYSHYYKNGIYVHTIRTVYVYKFYTLL